MDRYVTKKLLDVRTSKKIDLGFSEAFERNNLDIKEIFCNGDKVAVQWNMEVTHTGELKVLTETPIPATNVTVLISAMTIYHLSEGIICEIWQGWDLQGMLLDLKKIDIAKLEKKEDYLQGVYTLSNRERECINYLLKGDTAKETGKKLNLSFRTIESHIESAKNKLNCIDKRELFKASLFLKHFKLI